MVAVLYNHQESVWAAGGWVACGIGDGDDQYGSIPAVQEECSFILRAGIAGLSIQLRDNGSYQMNSFGEFSSDSYYGDFEMRQDTVLLQDAPLTSGRFLLILNDTAAGPPFGRLEEIVKDPERKPLILNISKYVNKSR